MALNLKTIFLYLSKWCGLFHLARYITRKHLRILCYHGFVLADEDCFRPGLFIKPATLYERMKFLSRKGFPVLPLDQALTRLEQADIPPCTTVIVIDDGFYSTYSQALKIFREFSFPVTVYVTTYYVVKEQPIFRLAVQYMFWKTEKHQVDLTEIGKISSAQSISLENEEKERVTWEIIRYGETQCNATQCGDMLRELGQRLEVNYDEIVQKRLFNLMSLVEIREMVNAGIDIQLHTHRHRLPLEEHLVQQEIADNRSILEPLVGHSLHHFCYPSGVWSKEHWSWLEALDIKSATTCDPGLNYSDTPRLALNRFLDGENISPIEFEAIMFGYSELLRRVKSFFRETTK